MPPQSGMSHSITVNAARNSSKTACKAAQVDRSMTALRKKAWAVFE